MPDPAKDQLNARILRTVELAALGLSNREIAARTSYSRRTVEGLVDEGRLRLDATNRAHLVARAISGRIIKPIDSRRLMALTKRELQVAIRIARGFTAKQIADDLGLAVRTVTTHVANAKKASKCHTSAQLAALAASWMFEDRASLEARLDGLPYRHPREVLQYRSRFNG